jgi:lipid A oxidase
MAADAGRAAPLAMISALLLVGSVRAETQVAGYLGMSWTSPSTVTVGGQSFHGVSWESRSFESPPYYGLRVGYFFAGNSGWGLALDFFHDKAYASAGSVEPALSRLSFSHGLNHLTVDVCWRTHAGPLQPYLGAGIGTLVPHVEAESETASVDEYQWFRGVSVKLEARRSVARGWAGRDISRVPAHLRAPWSVRAGRRSTDIPVDEPPRLRRIHSAVRVPRPTSR